MSANIDSSAVSRVVEREPEKERRARTDESGEEQKPKERIPIFKRPVFRGALALLALAAIGYGLHIYLHSRAYESTDDAFIEGHVVPLSPKVSGYAVKVYVDDNQHVKKGELLVEIDPRDYQNRLEQAKATLDAAIAKHKTAQRSVELISVTTRAGVQQASAGLKQAHAAVTSREAMLNSLRDEALRAGTQVVTGEHSVTQARAEVTAAEAEAVRARDDAQRYRQLYEKDEVSRQQLDNAVTAARTSVSKLDATRAALTAAQSRVAELKAAEKSAQERLREAASQVDESRAQVGQAAGRLTEANSAPQQLAVSRAQVDSADADIEQAKAALAQAELDLSHTKIYAPESGRVTRKMVEEGAFLPIGQPLLTIVPDQMWVIANFKETQLTYMRPGQPVTISVDAYPNREFSGKVDSVQAGSGARFSLLPPENATGNYVKV
ncbi:MAG: HlyD family secretion protein, partial [Blastocatellia bacterium]|nr:HlyD family secretion protein [Blastocatellia bacterium]